MKFALMNGEIIARSEAKVDVEDRGYQFGDGVYEVIRVYNGKMFTISEHLNRLQKSTESIGISIPFSVEEIRGKLEELIAKNNLLNGIVYMQISRGVAPRNHAYPTGTVPTLIAYTKEVERPVDKMKSGVKTITVEDIRWLRCDIKSLNLLGNIMAKQKAAELGCYEAIQYRGQEEVTEGSSSNAFIVKNGVVITHPSNHLILKGITKDVLFSLCTANNVPVEERVFNLAELAEADEVFLTSTTAEVMPIVEIDEKRMTSGVPGPVTRRLQEIFVEEIVRQCGLLTQSLSF